MASFEAIPLLSALKSADTIDAQVLALNAIKNSIVGHELRKVAYIRDGLILVLSEILHQTQLSVVAYEHDETQEEKVWVYTTNIVGSLAHGMKIGPLGMIKSDNDPYRRSVFRSTNFTEHTSSDFHREALCVDETTTFTCDPQVSRCNC